MSVGQNINVTYESAANTSSDEMARIARIVCGWLDDYYGPNINRDWALTAHLREQMGDHGEDMI